MELILTVVIGLIGGIAVGTQTPIAGAMSQRVGGAASSFIVHLGGLVASGVLLLSRRGENIEQWRELPWYMLCSGGLGLVLFLTVSHTIPKLGAVSGVTLIIVGQLVAGLAIDYLGAFGTVPRDLEITKIIGLTLLLIGAYLIIR
ncbi:MULTISPECIES: DMT family transporter [Vibrio]|nr:MULTISPECIES: DMT family transporter [Vibrio]MCG9576933.1 DMT family transporter [Vibrio tubiashii]MDC5704571.1 DMT family transporter [Vibrio europaeus]MDC5712077.1 DMT family transporter [Vibrio europaeus]MDC5717805.1 DMT family transporter [Vibrio europaeus]MDC5727694.1 DMT family transporter [Vibrio europaeus]